MFLVLLTRRSKLKVIPNPVIQKLLLWLFWLILDLLLLITTFIENNERKGFDRILFLPELGLDQPWSTTWQAEAELKLSWRWCLIYGIDTEINQLMWFLVATICSTIWWYHQQAGTICLRILEKSRVGGLDNLWQRQKRTCFDAFLDWILYHYSALQVITRCWNAFLLH